LINFLAGDAQDGQQVLFITLAKAPRGDTAGNGYDVWTSLLG
jgi:hypothetical protein